MQDLLERAIDLAVRRGAQYSDARVVENQTEQLLMRDGVMEVMDSVEGIGIGVRVLVDSAWGFASRRDLSAAELERVTDQAIRIAKASALVPGEKVDLGPPVTSRGSYVTPVEIDPFSVSLDQKVAVLSAADSAMARVRGIRVREGNLVFIKERRWFANSDGARTEQTIIETGGGIVATAVGEGEVQTRSYPTSFGRQQLTAGWEAVVGWDLPGNAERVASEAISLLTADPCPSGTTDIILGGDQVALQIHESCGHPTELDRVFGTEAAYAGTSFLTTEKLGSFRYGSEYINITADSVRPMGLGTFGWDDEGVPAQSTPLVKDGLFLGYLMSRETASKLGLTSNGCMRASGWNRIPLIRMTNVSLEPGTWSLEDLIADTEDGIYMEINRSWSIDDRRYNFQFGTEVGRGRASGAYRVATEQRAVANSEGTFGYHAGTQVDFQTVVMGDGSSGWAQASHWKVGEVPVAALGEEAIRKALDGKNRQPIEPEPYAVVLDPYATADLLSMLNLVGMSAQAIIEGQSWMVDRIGTKAMNEQVNIWDDGLDPRSLPLPFDYEGVPKQRVDIVSEGVVRGPVYDRKTAKRLGDSSTGHAMSPFLPQIARGYGPLALNLVMLPGEATTEELIASTERGLYITRFHYTRTVHPRDCVVTGMTRDGVFMIEQGKLTYPVKDLRFTQSYVEALRDVEAVGSETRLLIEDFLGLTARAPALKIKNFRFTGSTV